jgi:hypothetical protein
LANEISVRAAADTNILSIISVLTDRVSANSGTGGAGSVTSTELSVKLDVSVFNTAGTSVRGLQSVINALSNRISAISGIGGVGSVTSTELAQGLSVVSAQAASAINVVSAVIANVSAQNTSALSVEGLQSVINALSNRISVVSSTSGGGDLAVLAQSTTDTGPVNTTVETALFSFTLPTNLAAGQTLVLEIAGVSFNNSGSNNTFTVKTKIGTTDVITVANTQGSAAFSRHWVVRIVINIEDTDAQRVSYHGQTWPQNAGNFNAYAGYGGGFGTASEDTTSAKTFQLTCTNSIANANIYMYARMATLYRLSAP